MAYIELRGNEVTKVPKSPGLYAWYYRPARYEKQALLSALTQLVSTQPLVNTTVIQRYGMRYVASGPAMASLGAEKQAVGDAIDKAFEEAESFLHAFFQSEQFVHFCRPVYIGIAKNLWERVYNQHFTSLHEYWDPDNRVSKYLGAHPLATIQNVMDSLELPHSFALEARTCGIAPRDLMVSVFVTDTIPETIDSDAEASTESVARRALERLLQLLSDPVFGRR